MLKQITITTFAITALLVSMQASAANQHHSKGKGIDKEQRQQAAMIKQGIKTCQITPREAKTLKTTQKRIAKLERKFKKNGLRSWERRTLISKLHSARVQINTLTKNRANCRSKHNRLNTKHSAKGSFQRGHNKFVVKNYTKRSGYNKFVVQNRSSQWGR